MKKKNKKRNKWGSIKWHCNKCHINLIQDVAKICPFCGNEDLEKIECKD